MKASVGKYDQNWFQIRPSSFVQCPHCPSGHCMERVVMSFQNPVGISLSSFLFATLLINYSVAQQRRSLKRPQSNFNPVLRGGNRYGPGLKIRITKKGLNYVNQLAADTVHQQMPQTVFPLIERQVPGKGHLTLRNVRVTHFKPANRYDIQLQPPNEVTWSMDNMDVSLSSHISGYWIVIGRMVLSGRLDVVARGVSFEITNGLDTTMFGAPFVRPLRCRSSIRHMDVTNHDGGLNGLFINLFKGAVIDQMRPTLQKELCAVTKKFVERDLNGRLTATPVRMPLGDARQFNFLSPGSTQHVRFSNGPSDDPQWQSVGAGSADNGRRPTIQRQRVYRPLAARPPAKLRRFMRPGSEVRRRNRQQRQSARRDNGLVSMFQSDFEERANTLWIDYSMRRRPLVTTMHIETWNVGEVSYKGLGGTPFYPSTLSNPYYDPRRAMFYVLASDYVANSLMYHAHQRGMLEFSVTPATPGIGSVLGTECRDSTSSVLCLGDLLPELVDKFGRAGIELDFKLTQPPTMIFNNRGNGTVFLDVKGDLYFYVRQPRARTRVLAFIMSSNTQADTQISIAKHASKIVGKTRFNRMDVSLQRSFVKGITNDTVQDLGMIASSILEGIANGFMGEGLPIPVMKGVRLVNPRLTVLDRALEIASDLRVEPVLLRQMTMDAIQGSFGGI